MASKRQRRNSSLSQHKRDKKTLNPPLLAALGSFVDVDWRGQLPNMLWLAALLIEYPDDLRVVDALDAVDPYVGSSLEIADGRLTSFELVPRRAHAAARRAVIARDPRALPESLGHVLAMFSNCPGRWLYEDWALSSDHDRSRGIGYLRRLIIELADSRGELADHARMFGLGRYLQNGRLYFTDQVAESADVLSRYPTHCTEDERARARQFARTTYNSVIQMADQTAARDWSKEFWRECARIARAGHPAARGLR